MCPSANQLRCGPPVESTVCRLRGDDTYPPTRPQSTCCATAKTSGVVAVHRGDSCVCPCSSSWLSPPSSSAGAVVEGRSATCALMPRPGRGEAPTSVRGPEFTLPCPPAPPLLALSISFYPPPPPAALPPLVPRAHAPPRDTECFYLASASHASWYTPCRLARLEVDPGRGDRVCKSARSRAVRLRGGGRGGEAIQAHGN